MASIVESIAKIFTKSISIESETDSVELTADGNKLSVSGSLQLNGNFINSYFSINSESTISTAGLYFISDGPYTINLPNPIAGATLYLIRTNTSNSLITIFGNITGSLTNNTTWFPASVENRRVVLVSNGDSWYPIISGSVI